MLEVILGVLNRILVPLFVVGMAGSTLVVVITFVHDLVDFFAEDEPGKSPNATR